MVTFSNESPWAQRFFQTLLTQIKGHVTTIPENGRVPALKTNRDTLIKGRMVTPDVDGTPITNNRIDDLDRFWFKCLHNSGYGKILNKLKPACVFTTARSGKLVWIVAACVDL